MSCFLGCNITSILPQRGGLIDTYITTNRTFHAFSAEIFPFISSLAFLQNVLNATSFPAKCQSNPYALILPLQYSHHAEPVQTLC